MGVLWNQLLSTFRGRRWWESNFSNRVDVYIDTILIYSNSSQMRAQFYNHFVCVLILLSLSYPSKQNISTSFCINKNILILNIWYFFSILIINYFRKLSSTAKNHVEGKLSENIVWLKRTRLDLITFRQGWIGKY